MTPTAEPPAEGAQNNHGSGTFTRGDVHGGVTNNFGPVYNSPPASNEGITPHTQGTAHTGEAAATIRSAAPVIVVSRSAAARLKDRLSIRHLVLLVTLALALTGGLRQLPWPSAPTSGEEVAASRERRTEDAKPSGPATPTQSPSPGPPSTKPSSPSTTHDPQPPVTEAQRPETDRSPRVQVPESSPTKSPAASAAHGEEEEKLRCSGWSFSNEDADYGQVTTAGNMKVGPYTACENVRWLATGVKLYYWCHVVNGYGTRWTYARVEGAGWEGWVSGDNLDDHGSSVECDSVDASQVRIASDTG